MAPPRARHQLPPYPGPELDFFASYPTPEALRAAHPHAWTRSSGLVLALRDFSGRRDRPLDRDRYRSLRSALDAWVPSDLQASVLRELRLRAPRIGISEVVDGGVTEDRSFFASSATTRAFGPHSVIKPLRLETVLMYPQAVEHAQRAVLEALAEHGPMPLYRLSALTGLSINYLSRVFSLGSLEVYQTVPQLLRRRRRLLGVAPHLLEQPNARLGPSAVVGPLSEEQLRADQNGLLELIAADLSESVDRIDSARPALSFALRLMGGGASAATDEDRSLERYEALSAQGWIPAWQTHALWLGRWDVEEGDPYPLRANAYGAELALTVAGAIYTPLFRAMRALREGRDLTRAEPATIRRFERAMAETFGPQATVEFAQADGYLPLQYQDRVGLSELYENFVYLALSLVGLALDRKQVRDLLDAGDAADSLGIEWTNLSKPREGGSATILALGRGTAPRVVVTSAEETANFGTVHHWIRAVWALVDNFPADGIERLDRAVSSIAQDFARDWQTLRPAYEARVREVTARAAVARADALDQPRTPEMWASYLDSQIIPGALISTLQSAQQRHGWNGRLLRQVVASLRLTGFPSVDRTLREYLLARVSAQRVRARKFGRNLVMPGPVVDELWGISALPPWQRTYPWGTRPGLELVAELMGVSTDALMCATSVENGPRLPVVPRGAAAELLLDSESPQRRGLELVGRSRGALEVLRLLHAPDDVPASMLDRLESLGDLLKALGYVGKRADQVGEAVVTLATTRALERDMSALPPSLLPRDFDFDYGRLIGQIEGDLS